VTPIVAKLENFFSGRQSGDSADTGTSNFPEWDLGTTHHHVYKQGVSCQRSTRRGTRGQADFLIRRDTVYVVARIADAIRRALG
jgi:hypothetical protein